MTELGPIPVDWEVKRLGECCTRIKNGFTYSVCNRGSYKISRIETISKGVVNYSRVGYVKDAPPADYMLSNGDILFSHINSLPYIGNVALYDGKELLYHGMNLLLLRCNESANANYLYYALSSSPMRSKARELAKIAINQASISIGDLSRSEIPLPPLAEQRRIAGALSDVDELISALGRLIEKKRNIKTGAMQELLTGKTRLSGFKGKWVEKTFCEFISRFATGLNPRQNFKLNSGGNNYYITIKDFKNGKISFNGCDKIDDLALRLINERSDLRAGDLLFSSIGRVGDAYVIKETPSNWNINESVFSLRPDARQMDVNFLYYLVKSNAVQERLTSGITGSTLTGIKIGELRGIVCFYPSDVVEQKAIAAVLSDMDAEIAALEAKRAKYESIKQGMMQELLTGKTRLKGE